MFKQKEFGVVLNLWMDLFYAAEKGIALHHCVFRSGLKALKELFPEGGGGKGTCMCLKMLDICIFEFRRWSEMKLELGNWKS